MDKSPVDSAIVFPNTYSLEGDLSGGWRYTTFEQTGPGVDYFRMGVDGKKTTHFLRGTYAKIRFVQNRVTLGPSSQIG